jgi:hypothetical protein
MRQRKSALTALLAAGLAMVQACGDDPTAPPTEAPQLKTSPVLTPLVRREPRAQDPGETPSSIASVPANAAPPPDSGTTLEQRLRSIPSGWWNDATLTSPPVVIPSVRLGDDDSGKLKPEAQFQSGTGGPSDPVLGYSPAQWRRIVASVQPQGGTRSGGRGVGLGGGLRGFLEGLNPFSPLTGAGPIRDLPAWDAPVLDRPLPWSWGDDVTHEAQGVLLRSHLPEP